MTRGSRSRSPRPCFRSASSASRRTRQTGRSKSSRGRLRDAAGQARGLHHRWQAQRLHGRRLQGHVDRCRGQVRAQGPGRAGQVAADGKTAAAPAETTYRRIRMHVGKLMARLNAKNVRFDVGSGGVPELTSTDIAGALGMVPAGLGRELLCLVWWPDGACLTATDLANTLSAAQRKYAMAHAERWPRWIVDAELGTISEGYQRVRLAVLAELASPGKCPACSGRGTISQASGPIIACRPCDGTGRRRISDAWRADALNLTEGGYRRVWRPVYEWTMGLCADALGDAAKAMERAAA